MHKEPKIGTWVRRGTIGIWCLTHISHHFGETRYHYGGLYDTYFDWSRVIPKYKMKKVLAITKNFKIGDYVVGLDDEGNPKVGPIVSIFETAHEHKIWIKDYRGYSISLVDGTVGQKIGKPISTLEILGWDKDGR